MYTAILPLGADVLATEPVDEFALTISPNPSSGDVTLRYRLSHRTNLRLTISDTGGQTLSTITWDNQAAGEYQKFLPTKSLPTIPGVYFINIDTDGQPISRKIMRF